MLVKRVLFCGFLLFCAIFVSPGCSSLNRLPQPPPGQPPVGQPPVVGRTFPGEGSGGPPPNGPVGPPNEQNSILVSANINRVKPEMLEIVGGQKDIYIVKNASCTIVFSDSEKIVLRMIVRKFEDILAFGTLLPLRKPLERYKIAKSVKFQMPGYRDVLFKNIPIADKKLNLPDVFLEPIK